MFSVLPQKGAETSEKALDRRTEEAAAALLANPAWQGKTVVVVWEHKHIANAKLAAKSSGEAVTFRQLLQLDKLKDVPETWPPSNYDYFFRHGAGMKQCSTGVMRSCPAMMGARRTGSRRTANAI